MSRAPGGNLRGSVLPLHPPRKANDRRFETLTSGGIQYDLSICNTLADCIVVIRDPHVHPDIEHLEPHGPLASRGATIVVTSFGTLTNSYARHVVALGQPLT